MMAILQKRGWGVGFIAYLLGIILFCYSCQHSVSNRHQNDLNHKWLSPHTILTINGIELSAEPNGDFVNCRLYPPFVLENGTYHISVNSREISIGGQSYEYDIYLMGGEVFLRMKESGKRTYSYWKRQTPQKDKLAQSSVNRLGSMNEKLFFGNKVSIDTNFYQKPVFFRELQWAKLYEINVNSQRQLLFVNSDSLLVKAEVETKNIDDILLLLSPYVDPRLHQKLLGIKRNIPATGVNIEKAHWHHTHDQRYQSEISVFTDGDSVLSYRLSIIDLLAYHSTVLNCFSYEDR